MKRLGSLFGITHGNVTMLVLASLFLTACAGSPSVSPAWDASPAAMRQVFPDSEFIAQHGRGATRAAAEADGTAAIARFFNTELTSRIDILERYLERNGTAQAVT